VAVYQLAHSNALALPSRVGTGSPCARFAFTIYAIPTRLCSSLRRRTRSTIQRQMGHSSIKTTFDTYGHLMEEANPAAASRLASVFSRKPENLRQYIDGLFL
jgi:integrase